MYGILGFVFQLCRSVCKAKISARRTPALNLLRYICPLTHLASKISSCCGSSGIASESPHHQTPALRMQARVGTYQREMVVDEKQTR
jgi:hypothetical protein